MPDIASTNNNKITCQKGPQEQALKNPADIIVMGGANGGGKTYWLLLEAARHIDVEGYEGVIFRRESTQITNPGGLWDATMGIYPQLGGDPRSHKTEWVFESGAKMAFRHLQYDQDKLAWDGTELAFIGFDEANLFLEKQFWYLMTRSRSTCGINPVIRMTCNPVHEDDPTGGWLKRLIAWWLNWETGYPIQERSGVIRWFIRLNGELIWGDSKEELIAKHGDPSLPDDHEDQPAQPKSLTFIPSKLKDNPALTKKNPQYKASLLALPEFERSQKLDGNWNAKIQAGTFFKVAKIPIEDVAPRMLRTCRAWDLAATDGAGDYTAGGHVGIDADGLIWILDMKRGQWEANYRDNVIMQTAELDQCPIRLPQDPGAAGKSEAARMVRMLRGHNVKSLPVSGDKQTRASGFSSQVNAGNVRMLRDTPENRWNSGLLQRLDAFPTKGVPDDEIDCLSDAFAEVAKPTSTAFVGKSTEGESEPDHKSSALFVDDYVRDEWARIIREESACPRWKGSLADFRYDIGERPSKEHTLRLRDGNGMYEPVNVWWGRDGELPPVVVKKRALAFVGRGA